MKRIFMKMFHQGELRNKKNIRKDSKSRFDFNVEDLHAVYPENRNIKFEHCPLSFKQCQSKHLGTSKQTHDPLDYETCVYPGATTTSHINSHC